MQESIVVNSETQPKQWTKWEVVDFFKGKKSFEQKSKDFINELASSFPQVLAEAFIEILVVQPGMLQTFCEVAEKTPVIQSRVNKLTKKEIAYILIRIEDSFESKEVEDFLALLKTHPLFSAMSDNDRADFLIDLKFNHNGLGGFFGQGQAKKISIIFKKLDFYRQLDKKDLLRVLCQAENEVVKVFLTGCSLANKYPICELIKTFDSAEVNQLFNQASAEIIDLLYAYDQPRTDNNQHATLFGRKRSHLNNESICKLFWGYDFHNDGDFNRVESLLFSEEIQSTLVGALLEFTQNWFGGLDVQKHIGDFFEQIISDEKVEHGKKSSAIFGQCDLLIALYKKVAGKKDGISQRAYQSLLNYLVKPDAPFIATLSTYKPEDAKAIMGDEKLVNALSEKAVFKVFSARPSFFSQKLSQKLFVKISNFSITEANETLDELFQNDLNKKKIVRSNFLLNYFLHNENRQDELRNYFNQNPQHFGEIFSFMSDEKSYFSQANFLELAKTIITAPISIEFARKVFLELSNCNSKSCLEVGKLLLPYLTPEEILKTFIEAEKEKKFLSKRVCQLLLKELNFRTLPSLVKSLEPEWANMSVDSAKHLMRTLYETKYQLQEKTRFFPGFILSFLYGLIYYGSIVGILFHFAAPSSRPSNLYHSLKEFFNPPEIIKECIASSYGSSYYEKDTFAETYHYVKTLKLSKKDVSEEDMPEEDLLGQHNAPLSKTLTFIGKNGTLKKVTDGENAYLTPFHKQRIHIKSQFVKQQADQFQANNKSDTKEVFFMPGSNGKYLVMDKSAGESYIDFTLEPSYRDELNKQLNINRAKEQTYYGPK